MNPSPRELSHVEVLRQRAEIRKGLWRVHTAVFAIVTVVIGLALAAVFAAYRAGERADEAREARDRAQQDLWKSYLAQAMANRFSAAMGRKAIGEEVVAAAARIRPSLELRSEAIAQMALTDLREMQEEPIPETNGMVAVAPASGRCAVAHQDGLVEVLTLPERRPVFSCTR